ncbi:MAG TPA: GDSL-type esterase/lipase family protein [Thermoanaerobaculia bacterium]|nr:GDSL-type esterase/lipase family protein [Thermoanaerobaculia bacterium]
MRVRALSFTFLALLALASGVRAQTTYVAFGDSITQGVLDDPNRAEKGYPPRLEALLQQRGQTADVRNEGLAGETTGEALSRIDKVLEAGDDVLLLMEGTNDIGAQDISNETIAVNLDKIAEKAEARGLTVVHATVLPRFGSNYDGTNIVTGAFNGLVRELAWQDERKLADPFEVFYHLTPNYGQLYSDKLHPNAAGYDLLARVFADVLTNIDKVPPVTGLISPVADSPRVPPTTPVHLNLYDFGAGIDVTATRLVVNEQVVDTPLTGSSRKLEITYSPPAPWKGVVTVQLRSRDLANPPNVLDREITFFTIEGTTFLPGDIDRDGRVDGADLLIFAPHFGARRGEVRFAGVADLNDDNEVNGADLAVLASNFGKTSF